MIIQQEIKHFFLQETWTNKDFWIKLEAKQFQYLKSSGCGTQSYFECFANQVKLDPYIYCIPRSLPSIGKVDLTEIGFCGNDTEEYFAWNHMYKTIYYSLTDDLCPKLCTIEEYKGRIDYRPGQANCKFQLSMLLVKNPQF